MKKFKKVIPAMCMLLVSAVLLGTSTFAWFSMNNKVTANGMQVAAKANTQYFVVSTSDAELGNSDETTLTAHTGGVPGETDKVYPVSYVKDAAALTALTNKLTDGKYKNGDASVAPAIGDWYTANSAKYNTVDGDASDKLQNAKKVDFGANSYFLKYTFYVGLAVNSDDFTGTLTITATADTSVNAAVDAAIEINGKATKDGTASSTNVSNGIFGETDNKVTTGNYYLSAATTAKSYVTVTVYVYVDGADAQVTDTNVAALTGKFTITVEGTAA